MTRFASSIAIVLAIAPVAGCTAEQGFEELEEEADWPAGGKADTFDGPVWVVEIGDDFVELRNDGDAPADLDGWYLSFSYRRVMLEAHRGRTSVVPPGGMAIVVDADGDVPARVPPWMPVVQTSKDIEELLAYSKSLILRTPEKVVSDRMDGRAAGEVGVAVERRLKTRVEPSALGATPGARNAIHDEGALQVHFANPYVQEDNPLPEALAALIDSAEQTIDAALYQLDEPAVVAAFVAAADRGVAIRLATDSDYLGHDRYTDGYRTLIEAGVEVTGDGRTGRQHHKFVVVDGRTTWVGSYNPVATPRGFENHDNAVAIGDERVAEVFTAEIDEMFAGRFGPWKNGRDDRERHVDGARVQAHFSPTDGVRDAIIEQLSRARSNIYFASFSFYDDAVGAAMRERAAAGVDVRGVFDRRSASWMSQWQPMLDAGLDVRRPWVEGLLHHKLIIVDYGTADPVVITGSYNLSNKAETTNDESVVIIHDAHVARAYYEQWARLYAACWGPNTDTSTLAPVALTEVYAAGDEAFVEIANFDDTEVSLAGLTLRDRDGVALALSGTVAPGGRVAVPAADLGLDYFDPLLIVDWLGRTVATFDAPAFPGPDRSLERADLLTSDLDATWLPSATAGGTPGY